MFCLFYIDHKQYRFLAKLYEYTYNMEMYMRNLLLKLICFVFSHRPQKISFSRETLRIHLQYGDVHAKFIVEIN
jgi:hypothetical protein